MWYDIESSIGKDQIAGCTLNMFPFDSQNLKPPLVIFGLNADGQIPGDSFIIKS